MALLATAGLAPLPFSLAQPGLTANVLGENRGTPVITISGAPVRRTSGQLRMTTIEATGPDQHVSLSDVVDSWFRTDRAVMPRDSVYPSGNSVKEIEQHNTEQMQESQDDATTAALDYLHLSDKKVKVTLKLADVGGPSAGLLFTLGIIDKLDGNGSGGDLTGAAPSPVRGRSARTVRSARSGEWPSRPRPRDGTVRRCSWCRGRSARTPSRNSPRGYDWFR